MNQVATRTAWKNEPIDVPKEISISVKVSDEQILKIMQGLIPRDMEDKWFIYCEDDWLFFHRSYTGYGIFKAQLIKDQYGYHIDEFCVERNPKKYKNTDENEDRDTFCFLIAEGLLNIGVREIYLSNQMDSEANVLKGWSNLGSMMFNPTSENKMKAGIDFTERIKSAFLGLAVGDALGVPVEFNSRDYLRDNPITHMIGFGTHRQSPGTFSDNSSLSFCLAEALTHDFDLNAIAQNFLKWQNENYWTATGIVFDIGFTTQVAIERLKSGVDPQKAGGEEANSNGNGSLMRILPLVFHLADKNREQRFELIKQVSSITHRHLRSVIACYYYLEFALQIISGRDKFAIYNNLQQEISEDVLSYLDHPSELLFFDRLLKEDIYIQPEDKIDSSGYVIHTLEASIWCLLTTDNYKDAVLKAVNLGKDTDTTGAVTGGLAGLLYGSDEIPTRWLNQLAKRTEIEELAERVGKNYLGL